MSKSGSRPRILVTGTAGFIGFHLARRLLADGHDVVGYDGVTDYYDRQLKRDRLSVLSNSPAFRQVVGMLEDTALLQDTVTETKADIVIHLAAQAGVRYSLDHPESYIQSNIVGTANLLEALRSTPPRHFIFASTSSVYGGNTKMPFAETDRADAPVSLYAATKKAGEAMVHSYAHLFGMASTCVRFFTVYGPWGRPDMALFKFTSAILEGRPIEVFGQGNMRRDFTYVDDAVEAIVRLIPLTPRLNEPCDNDSLSETAPFRVVNAAGGQSVELMDFVHAVEAALDRRAMIDLLPMQDGDVVATLADASLLNTLVGPFERTPVPLGTKHFVDWYKHYYVST